MNRNNGNFLVDVATGEVYKDAVIHDNGYAVVRDSEENDVYLMAVSEWDYEHLSPMQERTMGAHQKDCVYTIAVNGIPTDKEMVYDVNTYRWFYAEKIVLKHDGGANQNFCQFFDSTGRDWTAEKLAAVHWFTDVYYGYRDSPYYKYSSKSEFVKVTSPVYVPTNVNK